MINFLDNWGDLINPFRKKELTPKKVSNKETVDTLVAESEMADYAKLTFEGLFEKEEKRKSTVDELVKRKMLHPISGVWIDFAKGNKQTMVCIIKKLHVLGHFRWHSTLNSFEIQAVCQNSFGVEVSIHHIRKIKWDDIKLDFIT